MYFGFVTILTLLTYVEPFALKGGRVVGGDTIDIREAPYQVSLQLMGRHQCGGTLVDRDLVVTAAHCIWDRRPEPYQVRAGSSFKDKEGVVVGVKAVVVHPDFSFSKMDSDVALIKLSTPLEFSEEIAAVPMLGTDEELEDGAETVVTGWGDTEEGGGMSPEQLQRVYIPTVNQNECIAAYYPRYDVTEKMLCAGFPAGGKDACQGDSGGPQVHNGKLVGVVSWGIGCARPNYPGVYARVSYFKEWLDKTALRMRAQDVLRSIMV